MRTGTWIKGLAAGAIAAAAAAPADAQTWRDSENRVVRANELLGKEVVNYANEDLGQIDELVLNLRQGQVSYAVLTYDGEMFAVPWDELILQPANDRFVLDISTERLDAAQGFNEDMWPAWPDHSLFSREGRMRDVGYTGEGRLQRTYEMRQDWRDGERADLRFDHGQRIAQGEDGRERVYDADPAREEPTARERRRLMDRRDLADTTPRRAGEWEYLRGEPGRFEPDRRDRVRWDRDGESQWTHKVSELLGRDVSNYDGNTLAELENLAIDLREGRIAYAILDTGVIGAELTAVPWDAVNFDREGGELLVNMSEERLEQAPHFDEDNWPNLADANWARQVHGFYGVDPYYEVYGYTILVDPIDQERSASDRQRQQNQRRREGQQAQQSRQSRDGQTAQIRYDRGQEQRLSGTIRGVSWDVHEGDTIGEDALHLTVRGQDGQTYTVHLPREQFLEQQGVRFNRGAQIEFLAAPLRIDGQREMIARQVTVDGNTIELMDPQGNAARSRQQAQQRQGNPQADQRSLEGLDELAYDPSQEQTLSGTIRGVDRSVHEGLGLSEGSLHLQLRTDDGQTRIVHVQREQFLREQGIDLQRGRQIRVTAAPLLIEGEQEFVARELTVDGRTAQILDREGNILRGNQGQQQGQNPEQSPGGQQMNTGTGQTQ